MIEWAGCTRILRVVALAASYTCDETEIVVALEIDTRYTSGNVRIECICGVIPKGDRVGRVYTQTAAWCRHGKLNEMESVVALEMGLARYTYIYI